MEQIIALLLTYKYLILLPVSVVEGPIITVICGFLVTTGVLNPILVYIIIILGDVIGDSFSYGVGLLGEKKAVRYGHYIGATEEKIERAKHFFSRNHTKALIASKLIYGIGSAGLVVAGVLGMPYKRYLKTCLGISLAQTTTLFIVGFFFGSAYLQLAKYLDFYTALVSTMALGAVIIFLIYNYFDFEKLKKKIQD
jgi:membrane protein DedA with SNARE-associated domain